ncbi:two-component system QseEF-associated lipoprotein QseG [Sodalis sp. dw_96]|uniref:two-component system QseEF-associated lipoprotein QseG n=1 Tax=Sodalis sp. dw_96 TaxID=2719794 RepID=UPI001BD20C35|nr:two-component system QseEF-associated lipoprotein QseG [Sodalis sp. dw_96]
MNLRFSPSNHGPAGCVKSLFHLAWPTGAALAALGPLLMLPLVLTGCGGNSDGRHSATPLSMVRQNAAPGRNAAECGQLWQTRGEDRVQDATYWLRAMECAERMTPSQARLEAENQGGDTWDDSFRESILLNSANISVTERRQTYQRLLGFRSQFPPSVYPVFKMWRQQQALRLILADERSSNQRQHEADAAQIELIRQQQVELQRKLDITTRKLENLTEIERRLSARKQGISDGGDSDAGDAPASDVPPSGGSSAAGVKTAPAAKQ